MAKAGKKGTKGKKTARKPVPKKRAAAPRRPSKGSKGYDIVCSECYSEFRYYPSPSASKINCPDCMHSGNVAAAEVMSKIAMAKTQEQGSFMKAVIPAFLFLLCGIVWIFMLTRPDSMPSSGVNYGFLGVGAILFIVMVAMAFKYESNRYEVYF